MKPGAANIERHLDVNARATRKAIERGQLN